MTSPGLIQAQRLGACFPKASIKQGKACGGSHLKELGTPCLGKVESRWKTEESRSAS